MTAFHAPSLPGARQLGQLMCDATRHRLWRPARDWLQERAPGSELVCRVGSGQATYHRFDPARRQHLITYGVRMIAAKHQPDSAHGWLSAREILKRGYFGGELSTLNLLAHTCCHEFAHLLQYNAGQRSYGSVHNRHFYRILDQLHASGGADATRRFLAEQSQALAIPLPATPFATADGQLQAHDWQVGEAVYFRHGTRRHDGEIIRVNRKTCTVQCSGLSRGLRYRVPWSLLRRPEPPTP